MAKSKPIEIDILDIELSQGLPHWLDPIEALKGDHDAARRERQIARSTAIQQDSAKRRQKKTARLRQLHAARVRQLKDAHSDWMDECVPQLLDYGKDQDVAVAACLNMWRDAWEETHPDGAVDPGPPRPEEGRAARARARTLLTRFDPGQPRDELGRWTDGGGGGGAGESSGQFVSASPADFIAARDKTTRPQFLSPLKPDDLSDHTLLVTADKTAGVAIDQHGDLQNLFNNGGPKGIAAELVGEAIESGARTLDCYDGHLPGYYRQFGFVETGRIKFNPEFAHGWDVNQHGQPDVVFMAWKGYLNGDAKAAIERAKSSKDNWILNEPTSHYAADYDAAKAESRVAAGGKGHRRLSGKEQGPSADRAGSQSGARSGESDRRPVKFDPNQPRDEDGRWTDGGGSSDGGAAKPIAGYSPGIKTPAGASLEDAKAIKDSWIAESPIKTIDDVKRAAAEGQQALGDVGRDIGDRLGLTFKDPGPKTKSASGVQRVLDKAAERNGNLAAVSDTVRATFLVSEPEQADQIIAELAKHFEVMAEPWKVTDAMYGDRAANVRLPNGVIGEVQMMHPAMAAAKSPDGGGGHDLYKISREAAPNGVKPDAAKYADAIAKQRALYGGVLAGLSGSWRATFEAAIKFYAALKALFGSGGKPG